MEKFDAQIRGKGYTNRSEAIRDIIPGTLVEAEWDDRQDSAESIGTITLIYDHHTRETGNRLTDFAHDRHDLIISSTHVHLTHASCLEVILIKGARKEKTANDPRNLPCPTCIPPLPRSFAIAATNRGHNTVTQSGASAILIEKRRQNRVTIPPIFKRKFEILDNASKTAVLLHCLRLVFSPPTVNQCLVKYPIGASSIKHEVGVEPPETDGRTVANSQYRQI